MFNKSTVEFDFLRNEKFLYGMYRPIYCWHPMTSCFKSHTERVSNVRLETLWYLSTFHKDSIYWKMSAAQNWIWPQSPSLSCTVSLPSTGLMHSCITHYKWLFGHSSYYALPLIHEGLLKSNEDDWFMKNLFHLNFLRQQKMENVLIHYW